MRIIRWYIIREHIAPFLFAFAVIMFILILKLILQVMEMLITKGIGLGIIVEFFAYNLAWMVALVVPMSVLVASVMAFGRIGASGEITAMKAAGISMYSAIAPIIVIAALMTYGMVLFNNYILPEANYRAGSLKRAIGRMKPTLTIDNREGQFISENSIPFTFRVDRIDDKTDEIYGVTLFKRVKNNPELMVIAERGRFVSTDTQIDLILYNGQIHRQDRKDPELYARSTFEKLSYSVYNLNFGLNTNIKADRNDRNSTSDLMRDENKDIDLRIKSFNKQIAKMPEDEPNRETQIATMKQQIKSWQKRKAKNLVEIHKKNSIPVAALVFVLIGSALGILVRRSGASIGIGLSIGFFTLYYLFLIGGESMGDRLILVPWLAMWLPNIVLGPIGLGLFIYAARR